MITAGPQSAGGRRAEVSRGALWFGLLGGAVAWTAHLMLAYATAEFGCVSRLEEYAIREISAVAWLLLLWTVVTTLVAAAATVVAYRCYDRLRSAAAAGDSVANVELSLARVGLLTSGLFTFVILFESLPIVFYLHHC